MGGTWSQGSQLPHHHTRCDEPTTITREYSQEQSFAELRYLKVKRSDRKVKRTRKGNTIEKVSVNDQEENRDIREKENRRKGNEKK